MENLSCFLCVTARAGHHKKGQVKETKLKHEAGNSKEYKVKAIWDSIVYAREIEDHVSELYYLVLWESYPKEENTWELSLVV